MLYNKNMKIGRNIRPLDLLGVGYNIIKKYEPVEGDQPMNVRVIFDPLTVVKPVLISVLAPTGLNVSEIRQFAEYCFNNYSMYNGVSGMICPFYQIRLVKKTRIYSAVERLPTTKVFISNQPY